MFPGTLLYSIIALIALIDLTWLYTAEITVTSGSVIAAFSSSISCLIAALILRALRHKNLLHDNLSYRKFTSGPLSQAALLFEGLFFITLAWVFVRMLNHLTMSVPLPWTDDLLTAWDQMLFLNWNAYFNFVISKTWLCLLFGNIYTSLTPLSIIAFTLLMLMNKVKAAEFFTTSFTITCLMCIIIGMFFPAYGAVTTLYHGAETFDIFDGNVPGVYHIPYMETLRAHKNLTIDLLDLPGLVTFPSFHTACGVLLIWCFRQTFLFWPVAAYSILMIASTPILGGHYFVDLIGGAFIALIVLFSLQKTSRYKSLFINKNSNPEFASA